MQWAVQNRPFINPCSGHLPVCAFFSKKIEKHSDKRPIKCLKVNGAKDFHSAMLLKAPRSSTAYGKPVYRSPFESHPTPAQMYFQTCNMDRPIQPINSYTIK